MEKHHRPRGSGRPPPCVGRRSSVRSPRAGGRGRAPGAGRSSRHLEQRSGASVVHRISSAACVVNGPDRVIARHLCRGDRTELRREVLRLVPEQPPAEAQPVAQPREQLARVVLQADEVVIGQRALAPCGRLVYMHVHTPRHTLCIPYAAVKVCACMCTCMSMCMCMCMSCHVMSCYVVYVVVTGRQGRPFPPFSVPPQRRVGTVFVARRRRDELARQAAAGAVPCR